VYTPVARDAPARERYRRVGGSEDADRAVRRVIYDAAAAPLPTQAVGGSCISLAAGDADLSIITATPKLRYST